MVWDVGFRYTYLPQRFIEEQNAMYSESETVALPLNPTYINIRILFSNPRFILQLTFYSGIRKYVYTS